MRVGSQCTQFGLAEAFAVAVRCSLAVLISLVPSIAAGAPQDPEVDPFAAMDRAEQALRAGDLEAAGRELGAAADTLESFEAALEDWRRLAGIAERARDLDTARRAYVVLVAHLAEEREAGDPELVDLRNRLAIYQAQTGHVEDALETFQVALAELRTRLPEDHSDVLRARTNVGNCLRILGRLTEALAEYRAVLEVREARLPEDHLQLQTTRLNLANCLRLLGDPQGSHDLELAAIEVMERTLPAHHRDLLEAKNNLAVSKDDLGDLWGAQALFEEVCAIRSAHLPAGHPELLRSMANVGSARSRMGDLEGARWLQQQVFEARSKVLDPGDPNLLASQGNLAATLLDMGDLEGARAIEERALAAGEARLPANHHALITLRGNLAWVRKRLGDFEGALELQRAVLEHYEGLFDERHPDLLAACDDLAWTLHGMGNYERAREIQVGVVEGARALDPDHPFLRIARSRHALTLSALGRSGEALAVLESELATCRRLLPLDHSDRLDALVAVANERPRDTARELLPELLAALRARLEASAFLPPRVFASMRSSDEHVLAVALDLAESDDGDAARTTFELIEELRWAATRGAGVDRVRRGDPPTLALARELEDARTRLADLVAGGPGVEQSSREYAAQIHDAALARDALIERLSGKLEPGQTKGFTRLRTDELARALPDGAVAVGYRRVAGGGLDEVRDRLIAHVLGKDGTLTRVELGATAELEQLQAAWLGTLRPPVRAGVRGVSVPGAPAPDAADELAHGVELRRRVLDPVLAAAGGARVLFVCLDDFLHLVPLDALPGSTAERVGDELTIHVELAFGRLLEPRPPPSVAPSMLLVGAVDYDAPATEDYRGSAVAALRGGGTVWGALAHTEPEIEDVARLFEAAFEAEPVVLLGEEARERAVRAAVGERTFLHIATHAWFSARDVASAAEDGGPGRLMALHEQIEGFAPMSLCGLALAGANRGRDELGRMHGILSAEELAGYDLEDCELAVLSACETNVGVRRVGTGVRSLQAALHNAGARATLTSLWGVDDAATRRLMGRFYAALWRDGESASSALWSAKRDLRDAGYAPRDWAGWVLTGELESDRDSSARK